MHLCQAHDCFASNPSLENKAIEARCLKVYLDKIRLKELFYAQKSRIQWLKHGNLNTRFFHLSTLVRRQRNKISCLKDDSGQLIDREEDVEILINEYFKQLYTSNNPSISSLELKNFVPCVISDLDNQDLTRIVNEDEILERIQQMSSLKAPGPDGLQGIFF